MSSNVRMPNLIERWSICLTLRCDRRDEEWKMACEDDVSTFCSFHLEFDLKFYQLLCCRTVPTESKENFFDRLILANSVSGPKHTRNRYIYGCGSLADAQCVIAATCFRQRLRCARLACLHSHKKSLLVTAKFQSVAQWLQQTICHYCCSDRTSSEFD